MYIALMEGDDPDNTRPVLMTRDEVLLMAFADAVEQRVRHGAHADSVERREVLDLVRDEAD